MTDLSLEAALNERVGEMLDACTRCGKCVEVCPSVQPAGIAAAAPAEVISGITDLIRSGDGPEVSKKWAASRTLSGHCIQACDEAVNPRFLLAMARGAMRRQESDLATRRRNGVSKYRGTSRDVATLARMQLDSVTLERLGQAGIDALVTIYHSDHRELCAHEREQPFRILNILEVLGQSMGLHRHDRHKELKLTQDADLIVKECSDLIAVHAIDPALAREVVVKAMLGDQPLPLKGSAKLTPHPAGAPPA